MPKKRDVHPRRKPLTSILKDAEALAAQRAAGLQRQAELAETQEARERQRAARLKALAVAERQGLPPEVVAPIFANHPYYMYGVGRLLSPESRRMVQALAEFVVDGETSVDVHQFYHDGLKLVTRDSIQGWCTDPNVEDNTSGLYFVPAAGLDKPPFSQPLEGVSMQLRHTTPKQYAKTGMLATVFYIQVPRDDPAFHQLTIERERAVATLGEHYRRDPDYQPDQFIVELARVVSTPGESAADFTRRADAKVELGMTALAGTQFSLRQDSLLVAPKTPHPSA